MEPNEPTGSTTQLLAQARAAYAARQWSQAREGFVQAARRLGVLNGEDLYALGDTAWWMGLPDEAIEHWSDGYRAGVAEGRPRVAALCCLSIAVTAFLRGQEAVGSAWLARAQRLLRDEPESVEHGFLLYLEVEGALDGGDLDGVVAMARRLQEMGRTHDSADLIATGVLAEGRALVRQGHIEAGMTLLDEAMLAALTGDLDPSYAGNIYCHLIAACIELADLKRAREWVAATERWLEQLPAAVLFGGICRVHRAQLLSVQGDWARAEDEARRVCAELGDFHRSIAAEGHYALGELQRLRGDLAGAEAAYTTAHRLGRDPQPGLALVRLAQGRPGAAAASVRAAIAAETRGPLGRAPLWAAQVHIALAAGDLETASAAVLQLEEVAARFATPGLVAASLQAQGALALARGDNEAALPVLRAACGLWQEVSAPYDAARVRVLLAQVYQALDDADAAGLELAAATETFAALGATPDLQRSAALQGAVPPPDGLTAREVEVLGLVAAGYTNREIATSLVISEKTVARHLSNIFSKLDITSRTAAAAYAFANRLAAPAHG